MTEEEFNELTIVNICDEFPASGKAAKLVLERMSFPEPPLTGEFVPIEEVIFSSITFYFEIPDDITSYEDLPLGEWSDEVGLDTHVWELAEVVIGYMSSDQE
jgi:hypothetical protein